MNKVFRKALLIGASALMLSSVGASFNGVNINAKRRVRSHRRVHIRRRRIRKRRRSYRRFSSSRHLPFTSSEYLSSRGYLCFSHKEPASYLICTTRPIKIDVEKLDSDHPDNYRWIKKGTYLHAYTEYDLKENGYLDWIVYNNKNVKISKKVNPTTYISNSKNLKKSYRIALDDLNYRNSRIICVYKYGFGQNYVENRLHID